jgi:ParB-like chromosome segregation protein Spo0J
MPSIKDAARKNLEKMVKGAAREVVSSRPAPSPSPPPARAGATAEVHDEESKKDKSSQGISQAAFQHVKDLIAKNGRTIQKVPLASIHLTENIREAYDEIGLKKLAESLAKDGLIQFPTLALKDKRAEDGEAFVCKNGHRRILAAQSLGWSTIECVILPFASVKDELYHTIAANLREDVFYLDLAMAYQQAARLGESDEAIAERSGVNPRTVGWYRRLTRMSPDCQKLARQNPELFHATWAIKLARQGELPAPAALLKQMQAMLTRQRAFQDNAHSPLKALEDQLKDKANAKISRERLKANLSSSSEQSKKYWEFAEDLWKSGFIPPKSIERIRKFFQEKTTNTSAKQPEGKRASTEL